MEIRDIEARFLAELLAAEDKHPGWPHDVIHSAAIAMEEAGELIKEAIDFHFGRGDRDRLLKEAAQTGAMIIRFLIHIEDYQPLEEPKTKYLRKTEDKK